MSKLKWLFAIFVVFALIAAACGDDDDDAASGSSSEPAPAEEAAEETAEAPAEETAEAPAEETAEEEPAGCAANTPDGTPGIDKEAGTIKIGTSQPFTGRAAVAGEGLLAGILIAFEEINAAGGIDGCTFDVVWTDDRFEIEQMVTNVRKMIDEDGVWGFVGTAGSQAIPSTYPAIEAAGTPLWGPVSPANQDIQEVYLTTATRTQQGQVCIDYFAEQGATTLAVIGQDNELGDEARAAAEIQAPIAGLELLVEEEVEVLSDAVAPAVLSVVDSGADAVLTAVDNAQNGLIMDQFYEAGYDPLMCSDGGSAGAGGPNTVQLANPEAADGYIGALQGALPDSQDPFVLNWADLAAAYDGPGAEGAPNFSLNNYGNTVAFIRLMDRMDGDYSYENFHTVAEQLVDDPIFVPSLPPISCGPLPNGHLCAAGAGIVVYDAFDDPDGDGVGTWNFVREFQAPNK